MDRTSKLSITLFRTLRNWFYIPYADKLRAIPIMLKDDAQDFLDEYQTKCETH